jgi:hypothetical protein
MITNQKRISHTISKLSKGKALMSNSTLQPLCFMLLTDSNVTLAPKTPFAIYPYYDEQLGLYIADDPTLGYVCGSTSLDSLYQKIMTTIIELWDFYANESDSHLSDDGIKMRFNLRQMFKQVKG